MTTTTSTVPAPDAPNASPGDGVFVLDGQEQIATVTRVNNRVTVSASGVSATLSALSQDGKVIALDSNGNLRFAGGDSVAVEGSGFAPGQEVEVWMFSTPRLLAKLNADDSGNISGRVILPSVIEEGNHRMVLSGASASGKKVLVTVGVIAGYESSGLSTTGKLLITLPIALAIIVGLVIPTTVRRRKKLARG